MPSVLAVRGIENTTPAFLRAVLDMTERIGGNADYWLAVMSFETGGSFDPAIRNPASGAVGLIQFTKGAAASVGMTREQLGALDQLAQLAYVERYLERGKGQFATLSDHYLAVFAPKGMGKPPGFVIFQRGIDGKYYDQNAALDKGGDGAITVADATAPVAAIVANATGRIEVPSGGEGSATVASAASDAGAVLGLLAIIWGIHSFKRLGRLKT